MAASPAHTPSKSGFDFTRHMRLLSADMVARLPELAHVDLDRVAIGFSQTRTTASHGLHAAITPMRFERGALVTRRAGGQALTVERMFDPSGREILYIISFYLPRFLNEPLSEKLATTLHELWHISPRFDGDLRRYRGRCYAHGPSQAAYDATIERLLKKWHSLNPPDHLYTFLRNDFRSLVRHHGQVVGQKIPTPKLIPVAARRRPAPPQHRSP